MHITNKYPFNLYENFIVGSFDLAEQLYLDLERRFALTKVLKLRSEGIIYLKILMFLQKKLLTYK
jgi:hypothetical protein